MKFKSVDIEAKNVALSILSYRKHSQNTQCRFRTTIRDSLTVPRIISRRVYGLSEKTEFDGLKNGI